MANKYKQAAFESELERLKKLQVFQESEAAFLTTEGKGISEEADIVFGDETDLEDLSEEERLRRSTGRLSDTGLFL